MPIAEDIAAFKDTTDTLITTQEDPNTIPPDAVGGQLDALADLVLQYYGNDIDIIVSDSPLDLGQGENGWIGFVNTGAAVVVSVKQNGEWVEKGTLSIGVIFPDGPLTNLRTSISENVVTVTPGSWAISNVIYQKATQTQFTLVAADLNFYRYDLIYADENNDVLILTGTPSSTPVEPTLPANAIKVDLVIVPSSSSGNEPYLESVGVNTGSGGAIMISLDQDDIVEDGTGTGNWYVEYKNSDGSAVTSNAKPYFIQTTFDDLDNVGETITNSIPVLFQNKSIWSFPRLYGFMDPATTQAIIIYTI